MDENDLNEVEQFFESAKELKLRSAEQGKDWSKAIDFLLRKVSELTQPTQ